MPMLTSKGKPKKSELPSTVARSGKKARHTFAKAHDSAIEQYGEGEQAMRTAYAALKQTHEKVGKRWEKKPKKGPSDAQAEGGKNTDRPTAGGVDANASKKHLYSIAKRLDIHGRSTMSKKQLVDAIQQANREKTAAARR